uniref:Uncharacterized protein n=1 Tax=Manihot esculenta TaxID=3983 RepID=A0A2C9WGY4_MANES
MSKSKIFFSPNVDLDMQTSICNAAGMTMVNDQGVYLGVPLLHNRPSKALFDPLLSKIDRHLAN